MAQLKKNEFNPDLVLTTIVIILKGFRQELDISTTLTECCDFVDWFNNNPAIHTYSRAEKEKFGNKFYTFMDYKKKQSVTVNLQEVKTFKIPFIDKNDSDYADFKYLVLQ